MLPRYDTNKSYEWNFENAPDPVSVEVPIAKALFKSEPWTYCGEPVNSPLGIAAGPLLNGKWLLYYASLGFDILTYKTVRSRQRASYELPNLQPVVWSRGSVHEELTTAEKMHGSWAVSFGMPSRNPSFWRGDVEETRQKLGAGKLLSVSVVATPNQNSTLQKVAEDFAQVAYWTAESGADCVEANFSCPNVSSVDGQLFLNPNDAGIVAGMIREKIPNTPLLLKIGHIDSPELAHALLEQTTGYANALVMANGVSARVRDTDGKLLFNGRCRGIAGEAIREVALEQIEMFNSLVQVHRYPVDLIGVGGISKESHVRRFLDSGCKAVQLATSAMLDPEVGLAIRRGGRLQLPIESSGKAR